MLLVLIASLVFPLGAFAEEVAPNQVWEESYDYDVEYWTEEPTTVEEEEEEYIPPVNIVKTKKVKQGGDKIHIIKVFEQKSPCDAILLESDGHFAMVDVGAPYDFQYNTACDTENSVVNYLKTYGVEKLDFVLFTHLHTDHIGNIENVLRTVPVDKVYARDVDAMLERKAIPSRTKFKALFKEYKVKSEGLEEAQIIEFGNLTLKVFNLDDDIRSRDDLGGENANCVCLLVTDAYGHRAFLAADMNDYDNDEDRLFYYHADELTDVDFFKVGHHGFEGSSTSDFVGMLNPLYVAVSGYAITNTLDPFGTGESTIWDNYKVTRAYKKDAIFYSYYSNNGIIFTMGEELSINESYKKPSRSGKANNTLSIYYNANGGSITDSLQQKFCIDKDGNICNKNVDGATEQDYVQQRMLDGDVAPMYYYDMARTLEEADSFGLTRLGHTFDGWYVSDDRSKEMSTEKKYKVLDLAPNLKEKSSKIYLTAKWKANPYTVVFYANGGKGSMESQNCVYNKKEVLCPNAFTREQFVFKGWNTQRDGSGDVYCDEAEFKNLASKSGKVINLYAQWEKIGIGAPQPGILSEEKPDNLSLKLDE